MIKKTGKEKYEVKSFTNNKIVYTVEKYGDEWICDCPAFMHRKEAIPCKHILGMRMFLYHEKRSKTQNRKQNQNKLG